MKISALDPNAHSQKSRAYNKSNRSTWKQLGYRMLAAQVHDEERELVLAELDVRKHQRMVLMAEDEATANTTLYAIATRNMAKLPTTDERRAIMEEANHSRAKADLLGYIEQSRHYGRKHHGVRNNYDPEASYDTRVRMEAKGLAYANLSAAFYRLALVQLDHAERTSIFGLRGDDTPPAGDMED